MDNFKKFRQQHNGVTWKEYVDIRFREFERSIKLAADEMNRRLEGMNELRQQLDRQAGTFLSRDSFDISLQRLLDRVSLIEKVMASSEGARRIYTIIVSAIVSAIVGVVIGLVVKNL